MPGKGVTKQVRKEEIQSSRKNPCKTLIWVQCNGEPTITHFHHWPSSPKSSKPSIPATHNHPNNPNHYYLRNDPFSSIWASCLAPSLTNIGINHCHHITCNEDTVTISLSYSICLFIKYLQNNNEMSIYNNIWRWLRLACWGKFQFFNKDLFLSPSLTASSPGDTAWMIDWLIHLNKRKTG